MSDSEVEAILAAGDCYTVSVADRLADYGISGVIAARATNDELLVEAFSLSCTILGKQVEYALLPALAEIASRHGLQKIAFTYQHSGRNQPTLAYLKTAASNDSENRFVLPVADVEARIRQSAIAPGAWTVSVTEGWGG
jgi:predicted enzyme involved in methoxymalonyl-ACP biosynthesis